MSKYQLDLYSDAKAKYDRFAITDANGNVVWYGKFLYSDKDYNGEQWIGELAAAKKSVWLASKVKEELNLDYLKLNLYVDAQWLTYQDHPKQKGYILTWLAKKYGIDLNVEWIRGENNPADKWTTESGYKNWRDSIEDLKKTIQPIIDEPEKEQDNISEFYDLKIKKIRGLNTDTFTRLQWSKINSKEYENLIDIGYNSKKTLSKNELDTIKKMYEYNKRDTEIEIQNLLYDKYKILLVFGKWLSETEKLFWLKTILICIEKSLLDKYLIQNNKEIILSIGAAGHRGILGFYNSTNNIVQLNHFIRKDRMKKVFKENNIVTYLRMRISGIASIFHEFAHLIDLGLMKYQYNFEIQSFFDELKEIRKNTDNKQLKDAAKYVIKNKDYFLDQAEIFARCSEMLIKETFIEKLNIKDIEIIEYKNLIFGSNDSIIVGSSWDSEITENYLKEIMYLKTYYYFGNEVEKLLFK